MKQVDVLSNLKYKVYSLDVISPTIRLVVLSNKTNKGFCFTHTPGKNCNNLKESIGELFNGVPIDKLKEEINFEFNDFKTKR